MLDRGRRGRTARCPAERGAGARSSGALCASGRPALLDHSRSDETVRPCLAPTLNRAGRFPTPGAAPGVLTLDRWRALDNESHRLPLPATLTRTPDDSAMRQPARSVPWRRLYVSSLSGVRSAAWMTSASAGISAPPPSGACSSRTGETPHERLLGRQRAGRRASSRQARAELRVGRERALQAVAVGSAQIRHQAVEVRRHVVARRGVDRVPRNAHASGTLRPFRLARQLPIAPDGSPRHPNVGEQCRFLPPRRHQIASSTNIASVPLVRRPESDSCRWSSAPTETARQRCVILGRRGRGRDGSSPDRVGRQLGGASDGFRQLVLDGHPHAPAQETIPVTSLHEHLERHDVAARTIMFRRDCPLCRAERVQGQLPSAALVPPRACAAVTAVILATSAAVPGRVVADGQGIAVPAPPSPPPPAAASVNAGGGAAPCRRAAAVTRVRGTRQSRTLRTRRRREHTAPRRPPVAPSTSASRSPAAIRRPGVRSRGDRHGAGVARPQPRAIATGFDAAGDRPGERARRLEPPVIVAFRDTGSGRGACDAGRRHVGKPGRPVGRSAAAVVGAGRRAPPTRASNPRRRPVFFAGSRTLPETSRRTAPPRTPAGSGAQPSLRHGASDGRHANGNSDRVPTNGATAHESRARAARSGRDGRRPGGGHLRRAARRLAVADRRPSPRTRRDRRSKPHRR